MKKHILLAIKYIIIVILIVLVVGVLFIIDVLKDIGIGDEGIEIDKESSDLEYSFIIDNEVKYRVYVIANWDWSGDTDEYWYDINIEKNTIELRYNFSVNVAEGHKGKNVYNGLSFSKKLSESETKELKKILDNALKENKVLTEADNSNELGENFNINTYDDPNIYWRKDSYYQIETEKTDAYKNGGVIINNSNDMKKFIDIIKK